VEWSGVGGGIVNASHRAVFEQACSYQVGKAESEQAGSAVASGNAQEQVGDHGGENLQTNGVFGTTEKAADFEMLFDPSKQQLDLPAFAVESSDLASRPPDIVAQDGERTAVPAQDDATQEDRKTGVLLRGEIDDPVASIPACWRSRSLTGRMARRRSGTLLLGRVTKQQPASCNWRHQA
jgi:hypothetical protein